MKQSLTNRIADYFKRHPDKYFNGGELERLAFEAGYKASNASRRLRELAESGYLEREIRRTPPSKIASVWYKLNEKKDISTIKKEIMGISQTDNPSQLQTLFHLQQA